MTAQRRDEIVQLADSVRLNFSQNIPVRVINIAQACGFEVFEDELAENISGEIRYKEKKIIINQGENMQRQRFSIAHELGHYFLKHYDSDTHISYRSDFSDEKEVEANYFAGCLLMPEREVKLFAKKGKDLQELSTIFNVSMVAMSVRMDILGL